MTEADEEEIKARIEELERKVKLQELKEEIKDLQQELKEKKSGSKSKSTQRRKSASQSRSKSSGGTPSSLGPPRGETVHEPGRFDVGDEVHVEPREGSSRDPFDGVIYRVIDNPQFHRNPGVHGYIVKSDEFYYYHFPDEVEDIDD